MIRVSPTTVLWGFNTYSTSGCGKCFFSNKLTAGSQVSEQVGPWLSSRLKHSQSTGGEKLHLLHYSCFRNFLGVISTFLVWKMWIQSPCFINVHIHPHYFNRLVVCWCCAEPPRAHSRIMAGATATLSVLTLLQNSGFYDTCIYLTVFSFPDVTNKTRSLNDIISLPVFGHVLRRVWPEPGLREMIAQQHGGQSASAGLESAYENCTKTELTESS